MNFPKYWDPIKWRVLKRGMNLWLELSTGEEKWIGITAIYQKIADPNEQILEINIYNRGATGQIWFPDVVNSPRLVYSRILKGKEWVYGSEGQPICLDGLWRSRRCGRRRFWGVRMKLKISENQIIIDIPKLLER